MQRELWADSSVALRYPSLLRATCHGARCTRAVRFSFSPLARLVERLGALLRDHGLSYCYRKCMHFDPHVEGQMPTYVHEGVVRFPSTEPKYEDRASMVFYAAHDGHAMQRALQE